jgi:hypothetical protein
MAYRRLLIRRDTAANWTSSNPTLAAGELGGETDTGKLKLGNGSTAWNSLAYQGGVTSINSITGVVVLNLDDINNVTAPSPSSGDYLRWNGTAWVNVAGQAVATTSDVTFNDVTVSGNLTVSGTTTTVNTATLSVADNIVVLNSDVTTSPTENAGIEVERGTSTNVLLRWNETNDVWELTNDGTNYSPIATESYVSTQTSTLDNLGDVAFASVASGDIIRYNGTSWVNDSVLRPTAVIEPASVSATAATGTINMDAQTAPTLYYTSNATADWTMNLRGSSTVSMNSFLATGQLTTVTFLATNGSTPYRVTAVQVDGNSVSPKWQGGSAPAAGNANSIDAYTFTILKTADATFTVFASQTRFA